MTATPRIYAEASKTKAEESNVQVYSMDDVSTFGPVFHRLRFDEAVRHRRADLWWAVGHDAAEN